ncbi:MAG: hypothetical protein QOG54_698 [Actinomycetota bacterium]|jgi:hypothetical protein|nr:hypothetical protein [Actinomycetota bacterium]
MRILIALIVAVTGLWLSPEPPPTTVEEVPAPRFASIDDALRFISRKVDVPVGLPPLPDNAKLQSDNPVIVSRTRGVTTGYLYLTIGPRRPLILSYGVSGFDGCGGDDAREVDVNGQLGLLATSPGHRWSSIIWPANRETLEGRYGLSGGIGPDRALAWARAMDRAVTAPDRPATGC